jgi:acyl-CoA thioester hydrolase
VSAPFVHRLRVRYAECDMQGHTYNAHYLTWLDIAHTEMLRSAFGPFQEILDLGVDFVLADAQLHYRGSARFDDEIDIAVALDEPSTTSLTSRFRITRAEDLVMEAELRHVCLDRESWTKTPWPDVLRAAFAAHVTPRSAA